MRIRSIDRVLFEVPYLNASRDAKVEKKKLPVLHGTVDKLPEGLDAIIATSDLQSVEVSKSNTAPRRLLGEALPDILVEHASVRALLDPERTGVLLAGDLFALVSLEDRGGLGDVRPVWRAFASRFHWVAGVAGNHDEFGLANAELESFRTTKGVHVLDGESHVLDGLRVGGVGGILQRGAKPRPTEKDHGEFVKLIDDVLQSKPDILVLHHGPAIEDPMLAGSPEIAGAIGDAVAVVRALDSSAPPPLVVCGHRHWDTPLASLACGAQVLNVDKRVVVLTR
jgi:hypothetical protein